MAGFTDLDRMYASLGLSTMTKIPEGLTAATKAEIEAACDAAITMGKKIPRSEVDAYYESECHAELHGVKIPDSDPEMKRPSTMISDGKTYKCRVAIYPFSKGAVRAAYYGKLQEGTTGWKDVILKEFLFPSDRTLDEYKNQSENSAVAKYLMEEFIKSRTPLGKEIMVIPSRILKVQKPDGSIVLYNVEDVLSGTWKRWTNNAGAINEKNTDLLEFTKWSYERSEGYLLVSDLQGAEDADRIILTDPAVLCKDKSRFGPTNFDDAQIIICLEAAKHGVGVSGGGLHSMRSGFSLYSPFHVVYFSIFIAMF
jgi:hypothetical protein